MSKKRQHRRKHKERKAIAASLSSHPHVCVGCQKKVTGCKCKTSYIFARCPTCMGMPTDANKADLNIGIVRRS